MRMNVIVVDVDVVVVRGHDHGHAIATRIRSTLATILMRWLGYERIQQFFFCLNVYHITQYISSVRARRQTANGCCSRQGGLPNERTETKQKKNRKKFIIGGFTVSLPFRFVPSRCYRREHTSSHLQLQSNDLLICPADEKRCATQNIELRSDMCK